MTARIWNGWGLDGTTYPLHKIGRNFLQGFLGNGIQPIDASLGNMLDSLSESRIPHSSLISTDKYLRLSHARGQSLPDWIELRSGKIKSYPSGVAFPNTVEEVVALLQYGEINDCAIIPYGGGTSVVGHINPLSSGKPTISLDLSHMNQLLSVDVDSHLATVQAGICGPDLETALGKHGFTLGHFPQSFELSTLGGWIATRSVGQQSHYYGRIESLFAGGKLVAPVGIIEISPQPASAAGPDLRQIFLGSEGRMGVITDATIRIRPLPDKETFIGFFFKSWEDGYAAVRELAQEDIPVSMLRLSDPVETNTTLALSSHHSYVPPALAALYRLGYRDQRCILIAGITGPGSIFIPAFKRTKQICTRRGAIYTYNVIGNTWKKSRFLTPYLRNSLWELGYAIDTLETAVPWSRVLSLVTKLTNTVRSSLESFNEKVLAFTHLSHIYTDGASVYLTYIFRLAQDPDENFSRWQIVKSRASQVILENGGTISHQHGVGIDHAQYMNSEKGIIGVNALQSIIRTFDPAGIMNPGKLLPLG